MKIKFSMGELSDLIKEMPNEKLGDLRSDMQDYFILQNKEDWIRVRNQIDNKIKQLRETYGETLGDFLCMSVLRIADTTGKYLDKDFCVYEHNCKKECVGIDLHCKKYNPKGE